MWDCRKCGEKIDDSVEVCWNCGTSKDGIEDPAFRTADDADSVSEEARPFVEALPRSLVPQALQPQEQPPGPWPPPGRRVACPNCGSRNYSRDSASPWPIIVSVLLFCLSALSAWFKTLASTRLSSLLAVFISIVSGAAAVILLVCGLLGPWFTDNAWCRDCGTRFKKVCREDATADEGERNSQT
jgi:hypothetical protein